MLVHARLALLSWLLLLFCVSCSESCNGTPAAPPSFETPPITPTLACPSYAGEHAYPELAPLDPASNALAGAVEGTFSVSTGSAVYSIPLVSPPGRHVEPHLSITYQSGTDLGVLGKDFSLSGFSAIARCGSTIAQDGTHRGVRLDAADHVCLDGQRLVTIDQGQDALGHFAEYRTFPDTQTKILGYGAPTANHFDPIFFVVYRANGEIAEYGKSAQSRSLWRSGVIRSWMMERELDRRGNSVRYFYASDTQQPSGSGATREIVPERIEYTGHVDEEGNETPGVNEIVFRYSKLDDAGITYYEGEHVAHDELLVGIDMKHKHTIVRSYEFAYDDDAVTNRRLLHQVSECAAGDLSQCRPPTTFAWSQAPHSGFLPAALPPSVPKYSEDEHYTWTIADVTGDGFPDIITSTTHPDTGQNRFFVYENAGNGSFGPPSEWFSMAYPAGFSQAFAKTWQFSPLDWNADGRIDLLLDEPNITEWSTFRILLSVAGPSPHFELVETTVPRTSQHRALEFLPESHSAYALADIDADGVLDFVSCEDTRTWAGHVDYIENDCEPFEECAPSLAHWSARLWRPASGFETTERPITSLDGISCWTMKSYFGAVDWDADGQTDLMTAGPDGHWWKHRLDTKTLEWESERTSIGLPMIGWEPWRFLPFTHASNANVSASFERLSPLFPDVNADGYPDMMLVGPRGTTVVPLLIVNGGHDVADAFPNVYHVWPPNAVNPFSLSSYSRVLDYDGDGRDDLLIPVPGTCQDDAEHVGCYVVYRSNKLGEQPTPITTKIPFEDPEGNPLKPQHYLRTIDIDGDSLSDVVYPRYGAQMVTYHNGATRNLLTSITTGRNPSDPNDPGFLPDISIQYAGLFPSDTYTPRSDPENDCAYPRACVVGAFPVVASYSLNDGHNQPRTFLMAYRDGRAHRLGRGFLGFGEVEIVDADTGAKTRTVYDNQTEDTTTHVFPYVGKPVLTEAVIPAGVDDPDPMRIDRVEVRRVYELKRSYNDKTYFVVDRVKETKREQNGDLLEHSFQAFDKYDSDANLLQWRAWAEGVDQFDEGKRVVLNDHASWLLGLVKSTEQCSTALGEKQCREEESELNGRGEIWKTTRAPKDPEARRVVQWGRDGFGNVTNVLADDEFGNHREACFTFEPTGTFVWATENAANHRSYFTYDTGLGALVSARDPNGLITRYRLDGFGRIAETHAPNGVITASHALRLKTPNWTTHLTETTPGLGTHEVILDAFGRPIKAATLGPDLPMIGDNVAGQSLYMVEETEYDHFGRAKKHSVPHLDGDVAAKEERTFDTAGRNWKTTTPWGTTQTSILDHQTITRTEPGASNLGTISTQIDLDSAGRPIRSTDAKGESTHYLYGPFGALRSVVLPDGTARETKHDAYGRLVFENDPDRGITQHKWNGFDELRETEDALGRVFSFSYDSIGRLAQRQQTLYEYDTAPNGIGLLARIIGADGHSDAYTYDALSRLQTSTRTLADGRELISKRFYDSVGRLKEIVYPALPGADPFRVVYQYDSTGRLIRLENGETRAVLWSLDAVDGQNQALLESFGNGVLTETHRDSARGVVESILTAKGGDVLQSLGYQYDARLNPTARRDQRQNKVERFAHDELDRLICSRMDACAPNDPCLDWGGACELELKYGVSGTIEWKSDVGVYSYDPQHPHAVHAAGVEGFAYDAVGNQIARADATITYTDFDLPREYQPPLPGITTHLEYSGLGKRVRKVHGNDETIYLGDWYERESSADGIVERYYVHNDERVVAIVERGMLGDVFRFVHADSLGSVDVITDETGQAFERQSFDAFGAPRDPDWGGGNGASPAKATKRGYTFHEWDADLGLLHAKGRIYDPKIARFLQTDPLIGDLLSTQGWDPYSYVQNRPLTLTDPTGYEKEFVSVLVEGQGSPTEISPELLGLVEDLTITKTLLLSGRGEYFNATMRNSGRENAEDAASPSNAGKLLVINDNLANGFTAGGLGGTVADGIGLPQGARDGTAWASRWAWTFGTFGMGPMATGKVDPLDLSTPSFDLTEAAWAKFGDARRNGDDHGQFLYGAGVVGGALLESGAIDLATAGRGGVATRGAVTALEEAEQIAVSGAKRVNGNAKVSELAQHVYVILVRFKDGRVDVFKYGVSGGPINAGGQSARAQAQVRNLNALATEGETYEASILAQISSGAGARAEALKVEAWLIREFEALRGYVPKGNE